MTHSVQNKCEACGQTFNSPNDLKEHEKSRHKKSKQRK